MSGSARAGFTRRRVVAMGGGAVALAVLAARAPARAQAGNVATLKIATVGAGREGGTLGKLFARRGHPVMFSSRHPEQLGDLVASAGPNARAGTVEQAIAFADVVLVVVEFVARIGRLAFGEGWRRWTPPSVTLDPRCRSRPMLIAGIISPSSGAGSRTGPNTMPPCASAGA